MNSTGPPKSGPIAVCGSMVVLTNPGSVITMSAKRMPRYVRYLNRHRGCIFLRSPLKSRRQELREASFPTALSMAYLQIRGVIDQGRDLQGRTGGVSGNLGPSAQQHGYSTSH